MALKGILFDKDNTLVDLAAFYREPVRRTVAYLLDRCGCSGNEMLTARLNRAAGFCDDLLLPESPVVAGTNWDTIDACARELTAAGIQMDGNFREEGAQYLERACLQYGTVVGTTDLTALLSTLKGAGLYLGVATSDHYASVMHCLRKLEIDAYFDLVLAADRVTAAKPAPEMAQAFCRVCGIVPGEVAMAGDSDNDMLFAKNSGMHGILYRSQPLPQKLPLGAICAISDLKQLPELLDQWQGRQKPLF